MAPLTHARIVTFFLLLTVPRLIMAGEQSDKAKGDYLPVIRQELSRLEVQAYCDAAVNLCRYSKTMKEGGRAFEISIRYSKSTDTVYICIENFLILDQEEPSKELAIKLLELNREMVTAKFELDKSSKTIRLSTSINTDSNFDRRAFRSQLRGIWSIAKRVWPKISVPAVSPSK